MQDVVIVSAVRTPIGSFLGSLSHMSAPELGGIAIKAALAKSGLKASECGQVYMGNVLQAGVGQAPARQASMKGGLPETVGATTINKVCGSGLMAVHLGAQMIRLGETPFTVAGGMESMSNAPYLVKSARTGLKFGHGQLTDAMIHDGLWDVYNDFHMGNAAELCASEKNISREQQDEFAAHSYRRAQDAIKAGAFKSEIIPVSWTDRKKGNITVDEDEEPARFAPDKMAALKPAFAKDGTVTAANASSINDGASATVLASKEYAQKNKCDVLATIKGFGQAALKPEWFTMAPANAIQNLLATTNLKLDDIDLFEINEAFSVVGMAVAKELNIDLGKVNVFGGAVALGHPIGASGNRILVTLVHALKAKGLKRGIAAICLGGGEAVAMLVEREG